MFLFIHVINRVGRSEMKNGFEMEHKVGPENHNTPRNRSMPRSHNRLGNNAEGYGGREADGTNDGYAIGGRRWQEGYMEL